MLVAGLFIKEIITRSERQPHWASKCAEAAPGRGGSVLLTSVDDRVMYVGKRCLKTDAKISLHFLKDFDKCDENLAHGNHLNIRDPHALSVRIS